MRAGTIGALVFLVLVGTIALFAPWLASANDGIVVQHDPDAIDIRSRLQAPSGLHPLGTDELGRDLASRMIHGSRAPLEVGFACGVLSLLIGTLLGGLGGMLGGPVDWVVARLTETALCFPLLFLALALAGFFDPSVGVIIAAVVIVSWPAEARIVRAEVMRLRTSDLSVAATAAGASRTRLLIRHLVPNAIPPAIVSASLGAAGAIGAEAALSFLGLGVQPPQASWGMILSSADEYMRIAWWIGVWPGLAIFGTILSIHVVAESARDWLDPGDRVNL